MVFRLLIICLGVFIYCVTVTFASPSCLSMIFYVTILFIVLLYFLNSLYVLVFPHVTFYSIYYLNSCLGVSFLNFFFRCIIFCYNQNCTYRFLYNSIGALLSEMSFLFDNGIVLLLFVTNGQYGHCMDED